MFCSLFHNKQCNEVLKLLPGNFQLESIVPFLFHSSHGHEVSKLHPGNFFLESTNFTIILSSFQQLAVFALPFERLFSLSIIIILFMGISHHLYHFWSNDYMGWPTSLRNIFVHNSLCHCMVSTNIFGNIMSPDREFRLYGCISIRNFQDNSYYFC